MLGAAMVMPVDAYELELNGEPHEIEELISLSVGPGITYKRLRSETYPLNVNMLIMDLNNEYNRMELTTANNRTAGTESLVKAATRQTTAEKRVIAGANGGFWCVATQEPWYPTLSGTVYGGSGQNGVPITETNMHSDQWSGGWTHAGIFGIDVNKVAQAGHMKYDGNVTHDKIGSLTIHQINKVYRPNEVALYTYMYGSSKKFDGIEDYWDETAGGVRWNHVSGSATEVILDLAEGQTWKISEPMKFIVAEVRTSAGTGTLGEHAAAIVAGKDNAAVLANLAVGDEITVSTNWKYADNTPVYLDNFCAGNTVDMINGELTGTHASDGYSSTIYSRCGYGRSADGKTIYIVVIDKSTDPVYGKSAGCSTRPMCEIARHYGCSDMVDFDAGGSAMMYYDGRIINKTTEGSPRAVSNGMFLYSIAPEDKTVARLEFYDVSLQAPSYSSFSPRIISYNQYGDVLDYDFKDFTLSCAPELGSCNGNVFTAGGSSMTGPLTASYNGVSVSKDITIEKSQVAFRFKPILIDDERKYPIEVTASIGDNVYNYDVTKLDLTVGDHSIINVDENGVLTGLKDGETTLTVKVGDFEDIAPVKVEIPYAKLMSVSDFAGWTIKKSGVNNPALSEDGTLDYTLAVSRAAPYVELVKSVPFFSLPESLWISFESDIQVDKIQADVRTPLDTRTSYADLTNGDAGFVGGTEHRVEFPLTLWGDVNDLINFPMTLNSIKFTFPKETTLNGAHALKIKAIETSYGHVAGIEDVVQDFNGASIAVMPNPIVDGVMNVAANAELRNVAIFTTSGSLVGTYEVAGNHATINVDSLASGLYIALVETSAGSKALRIIVK